MYILLEIVGNRWESIGVVSRWVYQSNNFPTHFPIDKHPRVTVKSHIKPRNEMLKTTNSFEMNYCN
jgi:hypothetical protein